ncbi:hypothetical protein KJ695_01085 [Patescibacteria group bacterium]|nr:hypothetical protein [Patescibacteria group bacterium]MBU4056488.1 hypothetical protein [Patescibacteria group bacterium]
MDYKPGAHKEKPVEQLTIYALALARLTSLRLYNFKCAWFDEENYYEFYPLHVVYKKKKGRKNNIRTKEGVRNPEHLGQTVLNKAPRERRSSALASDAIPTPIVLPEPAATAGSQEP